MSESEKRAFVQQSRGRRKGCLFLSMKGESLVSFRREERDLSCHFYFFWGSPKDPFHWAVLVSFLFPTLFVKVALPWCSHAHYISINEKILSWIMIMVSFHGKIYSCSLHGMSMLHVTHFNICMCGLIISCWYV